MKKASWRASMTLKGLDLLNRFPLTSWLSQGTWWRRTRANATPSSSEYSSQDLLDLQEMPGQQPTILEPPGLSQLAASISKQYRYDSTYLDIARTISNLSHDKEIRVGSLIVRGGQVLSQGWNGSPSGMSNTTRDPAGITLPHVIHSEANALMKLAKNGGGADGATIYCTHSPCYHCSLLLLQAGIARVVYTDVYTKESIEFLKERGVIVERIR